MKEKIIEEIRESLEGRNKALKKLYTDPKLRRAIVGTLIKLGCQKDEASDVFTDAIVSFVKSAYRKDLVVKSSLTNYLIGIAKNIWLKRVTKNDKKVPISVQQVESTSPSIETNLIEDERKELLKALLNRLDETCRKVLTLWSMNQRMKSIAKELNYKSEGMARKKKHHCLKRLYEIVELNRDVKMELQRL